MASEFFPQTHHPADSPDVQVQRRYKNWGPGLIKFHNLFFMFTPTYLALSNDVSEPFVIPGVSPTSPKAAPTSVSGSTSPITDASVGRDRSVSIIELS